VLLYAACSGSLECVKYLVEDRLLPMNGFVFLAALLKGNFDCVQYLTDQGCPGACKKFSVDDCAYCDEIYVAGREGFLHGLQLAIERGWKPNRHLLTYLCQKDYDHCRLLMEDAGWLTQVAVVATPLKDTAVTADPSAVSDGVV